MIPTKNEVNYKIDWHSGGEYGASPTGNKMVIEDRKHYFEMLRNLLLDLKNLGRDEIDDIFARYNIHFVDIDDIPRVNIDEPK
jgi:hypothetical protein